MSALQVKIVYYSSANGPSDVLSCNAPSVSSHIDKLEIRGLPDFEEDLHDFVTGKRKELPVLIVNRKKGKR